MFQIKSPQGRPKFHPFHTEDTNAAPQGNHKSYGNQPTVMLWNPEQPECGPVYHVLVNFIKLPSPVVCTGKDCLYCQETRDYTETLNTLFPSRNDDWPVRPPGAFVPTKKGAK